MTTLWNPLLATESLEHLGDPAGEVRAARDATVISPLADLACLHATGEEAADFLHNLLTNDIKGLAPEAVQRAGFCTPKGRLLADFLVWHDNGSLLLQTSADLQPAMLKKLSMYILRAKAKLADAGSTLAAIGLAGSGAETLLASLGASVPEPMRLSRFEHGSVIGLGPRRFQIVVPAAQAAAVWQQLAATARPVGLAAWRWLDIAAGIPHIALQTQELFVPQMVNFELIGGVGFKKGCYPGQEIVARTQYLGKIKKRMWRAALAGSSAATIAGPGSPLYAPSTGDQVCGNVVSAAPSPEGGRELLIVVPEDVAHAGQIQLGAVDGPQLTLLELPYALS